MPEARPTLKETLLPAAQFREIARGLSEVWPDFEEKRFLSLALDRLDELSLMARVDRLAETLRATLPEKFSSAVKILKRYATSLEKKPFVAVALSRFTAVAGAGRFDEAMEALSFFTRFGSSEFAVREFIRRDQARALATMLRWSQHPDEHVRRLSCEGCRPRLPWSFRLDALDADPTPSLPVLENLRADPSLYVRKSVANHLNDITKNHPSLALALIAKWPDDDARTRWIVKRGLRTLIKNGDRRALAAIGAGTRAKATVTPPDFSPRVARLGGETRMTARVVSESPRAQRLVIDFAMHYARPGGKPAKKVFKWKELDLPARGAVALSKKIPLRDFSTRKHHAGDHRVEILVNGEALAEGVFKVRR